MNKTLLLTLVLFLNSVLSAQNLNEQKFLLTSKTNTVGFSVLSLTDPYLSPLTYTGNGIQFEHDSHRLLSLTNPNVSILGKLNMEAGLLLNPAQTSSMMYLELNYNWGMYYHFRPLKGLLLLAGGSLDVDLGYKDVPRNINNPGNVDLATNLNFSGIAIYDIQLHRRTLRLQLAVETPLIGWMYVPLAGASYYEMFELGNLANISHFSSIINRRGINPKLTIEVPFKKTVWQAGIKYQTLQYSANNIVFNRNELSLIIATTFDVARFGGRKRKAPLNFISPNE